MPIDFIADEDQAEKKIDFQPEEKPSRGRFGPPEGFTPEMSAEFGGGTPPPFSESFLPIPEIKGKTTAGKVGAGLANVALGIPKTLASPIGLLTAPVALAPGGPAILGGVFGGLTAKGAGQQLGEASVTGDVQQATEGAASALLAPVIALGGRGKKPKPLEKAKAPIDFKEEVAPEVKAEPQPIVAPEAPKPEPAKEPAKVAEVPPEVVSAVNAELDKTAPVAAETGKSPEFVQKAVEVEAKDHPEIAAAAPQILPQIVKDELKIDPKAYEGEVPKSVEEQKPKASEKPMLSPEEWEAKGVKYARRDDGTLKTKEEYTPDEWRAYTDSVIETKLKEQKSIPPPVAETKVEAVEKPVEKVTELPELRPADVKADPRLDMPGITRAVKPDSIVVQLRDLDSNPVKDITLKSTGDPMADAKKIEATIRKNAGTRNISFRESLGVTTGPNGRAIYKFGMSPNGMAWASAKEWIDLVEKAKIERGEPAPVPPNELIGMGGAVASEFEKPDTAVSNMFAAIDRDRAAMGKPPLERSEGRTWDQDNAIALSKMNKEPEWIPNLINEVEARPRPLLSWENAALVWHRLKLKAELNGANERIYRSFEDKRTEDKVAAQLDAARFEDELERLDRVVKIGRGTGGTGSEAGRSLQAQKMGTGEDFSLIEMRLAKRAAKGGERLTPKEEAEIAELHRKLEAKQKEYDAYVAAASDREAKWAFDRIALEAKAQPKIHPKIMEAAQKIVAALDSKADAARARIKARMSRMSAGVDPSVLVDLAEIGASHLGHAALDFAVWSSKMVADVGDWVKPHLEEVFKRSNAIIDGLTVGKPEVKRAIKSASPDEQIAGFKKGIQEKVEAGKAKDISWYVARIARTFVVKGIEQREALIDAVHGVLKEVIPGITRRQTMDAISGYGDYKQLSKDQITIKLRGMKGEMQQLAKLEDMAAGKPPLKSGVERRTPTEAERKLIKEVNDAKNRFQVPVQDPNTQLKSALDTLKTTLQNRITDYQDRLARGDFAPRPRREVLLDRDAQRLKIEAERIKQKFREGLLADRLKNRTTWEKGFDWFTKFRRFGVLSSPMVIPKLVSAGIQRLASLPLEELAGSAIRHIPGVSAVAKRAPLEGIGSNLKAEMTGFGAAFTKGLKDAADVIKTGRSDIDVQYGKAKESYTGEYEMMSKLLAFPGRLHGMIKAPVKRATFERATQRLGEFYAKQGLDLTDPVVQMRIGTEAYKAANRSIFLNDNFVASKINGFLSEKIDKATGHATPGSKVWSTAGRFMLPIIRVPTNIVAETMQYAFGLVSGPVRVVAALRNGIEKLPPEHADLIMRELKKGSIGGAALLAGYFLADDIGGYYQPGEKRKANDLKPMHMRIAGADVPPYLLHNPLLETIQFGATIRRVSDSFLSKKDKEPQGLARGTVAAALGLTEQVPFVNQMVRMDKLVEPRTRDQFFGEQLKSMLVPAAVSKAAEWTDEGKQRKPRDWKEWLKTGIPGLRQEVPEKKK